MDERKYSLKFVLKQPFPESKLSYDQAF